MKKQTSQRRFGLVTAVAALAAMAMPGVSSAQNNVAEQLRTALNATVASAQTQFPGAILYVSHPQQGTWVGAAGVADIETGTALGPDARFRAGSIMKPFVAAVVLQLVEEGKLSLDDTITELLPNDVTARFSGSDRTTLKMLLNHTSGIPEWISGPVIEKIVANPAKLWDVAEFLDLAAAKPATFDPGNGWSYSNTDYNLLGLVIEQITGKSWRAAVTERVIEPLGLADTSLPEPGNVAIEGALMHGYGLFDGKVLDLTNTDPSMAGAAGGGALVTTVTDLAAFMSSLLEGALFQNADSLAAMTDFVDAPDTGGQVGYGLGLQKYELPGGLEMVGHLGGTAGYTTGTFYFPELDLSMAFALSAQIDPTPVIAAALDTLAPGAMTSPAAVEITEIPPVVDADSNEIVDGLASLEKVKLGGVDQWILIRAQDASKPVLLILHGGPGGAQMPWVDLFQPAELEKNFVVVQWDQRGAGKSFDPELTADDLQVEDYVSDTLELTDMLRTRFGQEKIFLTGHSWGSALGFLTLMENSEPFHAYIPSGERVHWIRSHNDSFAWVKEQALKADDVETLEQIAAIEPFDATNEEHLDFVYQGQERFRGGDIYTEGLWEEFLEYAISGKSPYYTEADIGKYIPGLQKSSAALADFVVTYDLFSDFPSATIPVHFLVGENDHNTAGDLAREYYQFLDAPAKSFTIIKDAGHSFMYEKPDAWAAALIKIADDMLSN
jgi:D-alanyl-D-alanine carboxypeptidase